MKPKGPFQLLQGQEYQDALKLKKAANKAFRKELGITDPSWHVHEIHPVKFGGSPTDVANKVILKGNAHLGEVSRLSTLQIGVMSGISETTLAISASAIATSIVMEV